MISVSHWGMYEAPQREAGGTMNDYRALANHWANNSLHRAATFANTLYQQQGEQAANTFYQRNAFGELD